MYVLTLVFSFLIIFAIISSAQLDQWKKVFFSQKVLTSSIQDHEYEIFDEKNATLYETTPATHKEERSFKNEEKPGVVNLASRTLSISLLLHTHEGKEAEFQQQKFIFERLISILYEGKTFYKNLLETMGDHAPNLLIESLIRYAPQKKKWKRVSELSEIDLQNPQLNLSFFYMLKGNQGSSYEDTYPSLLSFLTLNNRSKIRVFLAPRQLLEALFSSTFIVDEIIETRNRMYYYLKNHPQESAQSYSQEFSSLFAHHLYPGVLITSVDFSVSRTRP